MNLEAAAAVRDSAGSRFEPPRSRKIEMWNMHDARSKKIVRQIYLINKKKEKEVVVM